MKRISPVLLIACVLGQPARAGTSPRVALQHALTPGTQVTYDVSIKINRTRAGPIEQSGVEYLQTGRLIQYLLAADRGHARRVQMLELDATKVRRASRDGLGIDPPPSAAGLGLSPGGVYMTIDEATSTHAPPLTPGELGEWAGLATLLSELLEWPADEVAPGGAWSRPIAREGLRGRLLWTLERVDDAADNRRAVVAARFEPAKDAAAGSPEVESATAELVWDLAAGSASRLSARLELRFRRPDFDEDYEIELITTRRDLRALDESEQRQTRNALTELAAAAAAERSASPKTALEKAQAFVRRWPDSPWRPVADQLVAKLTAPGAESPEPAETASEGSLQQQLASTVEQWQVATRDGDEPTLRTLRGWFEGTVAANHDAVRSLLEASDPGPRAVGVFALAFSKAPLDLVALQEATGDTDARVRAWAAYALATRADPATEFRTLQALAGDDDANVRARACEAVAACVPPGSRNARKARLLLLAKLTDDYDGVRYQAAVALTSFAQPADLPCVEAVRQAETTAVVRDALDRLVEIVRARAGQQPE